LYYPTLSTTSNTIFLYCSCSGQRRGAQSGRCAGFFYAIAARSPRHHGQWHSLSDHEREQKEDPVAMQLDGHQEAQVSCTHHHVKGDAAQVHHQQGGAPARRAQAEQVQLQQGANAKGSAPNGHQIGLRDGGSWRRQLRSARGGAQ